jgi:hypothetical protein
VVTGGVVVDGSGVIFVVDVAVVGVVVVVVW